MKKSKTVDEYIDGIDKFQDILLYLRDLLKKTDLTETVKWGMPTYTIKNKNVVGISAFKNHAGIWFFQGALLTDHLGVLENAQEGKTQAMRHWKFTDISQIDEDSVLTYLQEAIENERAGKRVAMRKAPALVVPEALQNELDKNIKVGEAFKQLTHGKQRDYSEYISMAKRAATVES